MNGLVLATSIEEGGDLQVGLRVVPETGANLWLYPGASVVLDSGSLTDIEARPDPRDRYRARAGNYLASRVAGVMHDRATDQFESYGAFVEAMEAVLGQYEEDLAAIEETGRLT